MWRWVMMLDELPAVFGVRADCHSLSCVLPYTGSPDAEGLQAFVADALLQLPAILVVDRHTLDVFLARCAPWRHLDQLAEQHGPLQG